MKLNLVAVGNKMPTWVDLAVNEYGRRLPPDFALVVKTVPLAKRSKTSNIDQCVRKEAEALLARLGRDDVVVALEVKGRVLDTESLARRINAIREQGRDLSLLVGGPDGLGEACLARASEQWSLSALTLPHPLVRILVAEQLYRVWSLLNQHPYHRD
ncbi:MAG: rRNA ((1915)-N(3))-methyltransferase RlmH [Pseudomonadota bacterium]|jgi:23S rRNA (pseudouridine1915-N3)-methyltransferase